LASKFYSDVLESFTSVEGCVVGSAFLSERSPIDFLSR